MTYFYEKYFLKNFMGREAPFAFSLVSLTYSLIECLLFTYQLHSVYCNLMHYVSYGKVHL